MTALVAARVASLGVGEATTASSPEDRRFAALLANAIAFMLGSAIVTAAIACAR